MTKILLVDDNPDNLQIMTDTLIDENDNYNVFQAFNITDAYAIAQKRLPDLVLTDWEMPNGSGIDLIKQLRTNELTKEIPIIMVTGIMTDNLHLKTAFDAGAIDYVRKPVDKIELIARVRSILILRQYHKMQIEAAKQLEEAKYQAELRISTFELSQKTLQIAQMIGHNRKIQALLDKIVNNSNKKVQTYISQLKLNLNIQTPDVIWQEFLINFEKIHPLFLSNLLNKFPNLTPNEKQYCTYLRMNFSIADISAIVEQSENTVKTARKRLRKTLNIDTETSLYNFLSINGEL